MPDAWQDMMGVAKLVNGPRQRVHPAVSRPLPARPASLLTARLTIVLLRLVCCAATGVRTRRALAGPGGFFVTESQPLMTRD